MGTGPAHSHRAHSVVDGGSRKGRKNWELDQEQDEALATEQRRGAEERRLDGSPWAAIRMGLAGCLAPTRRESIDEHPPSTGRLDREQAREERDLPVPQLGQACIQRSGDRGWWWEYVGVLAGWIWE